MEIVYFTRKNNDKNLEIGSANAITVLNVSHYSFSSKDLSFIKIPGAELAGGEFVETDFSNAVLTGVNLRSTILSKSKFINTKMENVELGILPSIKFKD